MEHLIEVKGVHKHFQMGKTTVKAINGVDLVIDAGEKIMLGGASGSGKTLLLQALAGQYPAGYALPCKVAMLTQQPVLLGIKRLGHLQLLYKEAHSNQELLLLRVPMSI